MGIILTIYVIISLFRYENILTKILILRPILSETSSNLVGIENSSDPEFISSEIQELNIDAEQVREDVEELYEAFSFL